MISRISATRLPSFPFPLILFGYFYTQCESVSELPFEKPPRFFFIYKRVHKKLRAETMDVESRLFPALFWIYKDSARETNFFRIITSPFKANVFQNWTTGVCDSIFSFRDGFTCFCCFIVNGEIIGRLIWDQCITNDTFCLPFALKRYEFR